MYMIIQSSEEQKRTKQKQENKQLQYYKCDIQKIINGIYIGDQLVSNNLELLQNLHIKHIIVVGAELTLYYPKLFNYLHIPVRDHRKETISNFFDVTNSFIEKHLANDQFVLVHCAEGRSRSATIILAFLMYKYKMHRQRAISFVKRKRNQISPNEGFLFQLQQYQQKLGIPSC